MRGRDSRNKSPPAITNSKEPTAQSMAAPCRLADALALCGMRDLVPRTLRQ